jgi:methyl-accepting chemotaxis protein
MRTLTIKRKLQLTTAFIMAVVIIETVLISDSAKDISQHSRALIEHEMKVLNNAYSLKFSVVQVQQWLTDISATRGLDGLDDGFDLAADHAREFGDALAVLRQIDPENRERYDAMATRFEAYYSVGQEMARAYIASGPAGGNQIMAAFDAEAVAMTELVEGFLASSMKRADTMGSRELTAADHLNTVAMVSSALLIAAALMSIWVGHNMLRYFGAEPEHLKSMADRIANGDFSGVGDETKARGIYARLLIMRRALKQQLRDIRQQADENGRVRTTLDNVTSPVMMLNTALEITYLNGAAQALFQEYETHIRTAVGGFSAANLLHQDASPLLKPSPELHSAAKNLQRAKGELRFRQCVFDLICTPVRNGQGERIGLAVELVDRTDQVAIEEEIDDMVKAARAGNLHARIDEHGKEGFFKDLSANMNELVAEVESVFNALGLVLSRMASGVFSEPMQGEFKGSFSNMKRDVNTTLSSLSDVIQQLRSSIVELESSSLNIERSNGELAAGASQQAGDLETIASVMTQITSTVKNNADKAEEVSSLTHEAAGIAESSRQVVRDAVASMSQINESSARVQEIISVIDEIAFQTNLLALNASVEAARAGEQGRGFAVVASEVRNLAGRSAVAAKEIKELIEDSVSKVAAGTAQVNRSGDTLEQIAGKITEITALIGDIATANREQSLGVNDVSTNIISIDKLTRNNAVLAREVQEFSATMRHRAAESNQKIAFFK